MRIAISGTANTGKTTLIEDFLKCWPTFKTTDKTYRQFLAEGNHSTKTNKETQHAILNWMVDQLQEYKPEDNVIFDRCPLDNLVYTLWGVYNESIPAKYADEILPIVRESLRHLDIIFFIPFDPSITVVDDGVRETSAQFIKEVDAIFNNIYDDYVAVNEESFIIFPKDDMPAVIPLQGNRHQRINHIAEYIDITGSVIDTAPDESVLNPEQIKLMEQLVKMQEGMQLEDKFSI